MRVNLNSAKLNVDTHTKINNVNVEICSILYATNHVNRNGSQIVFSFVEWQRFETKADCTILQTHNKQKEYTHLWMVYISKDMSGIIWCVIFKPSEKFYASFPLIIL